MPFIQSALFGQCFYTRERFCLSGERRICITEGFVTFPSLPGFTCGEKLFRSLNHRTHGISPLRLLTMDFPHSVVPDRNGN